MKLLIFIPCILLLSCNDNTDNATAVKNTSATGFTDSGYRRSIPATKTNHLWEVNAGKKTLKRNSMLAPKNADIDSLVNGLNQGYENIFLQKIALKKDTLQLKINDSDFLVNQLNPKAVQQYLADAVINLTAIPGVSSVELDFKAGKNLAPRVWKRKDFPGYIMIQ